MLSRDAQRESAELVILSLLAEGPQYGYALSKQAAVRSNGKIGLAPGVLYPLLAKLEKDGLISSSWEEVKSDRADEESRGRRRKWYRLSPKGRKRLAQRIDAHRTYLEVIERFIGGRAAGEATE